MSAPRFDLNTTFFKLLSAVQEPPPEILSRGVSVLIRTARFRDLPALADILVLSFHPPDGWMKWMIPILRLGIYEDLRHRLQTHRHPSDGESYACLVAAQLPGGSEPEGTGRSPSAACDQKSGTASESPLGDVVGTVELSVRRRSLWQGTSGRTPSKYVYLSNLAVRADCRRRGVASQLLCGCDAIAQRWGFQDIYLHVLENNISAKGLYHKLGYRVVQVDGDLLTWVLNRPRQVLLHKRLHHGSHHDTEA